MIDAKVNGTGPARDDAGALASVSGGREADGANGTSGGANGATPDAGNGFALANLAFAEELYFQFLRDPGSVEPAWRAYFQRLDGADAGARAPAAAIPPQAFGRSIFAPAPAPKIAEGNLTASRTSVRLLSERVQRLVEAYREFGHLAAHLDPLGLLARTGASLKLEEAQWIEVRREVRSEERRVGKECVTTCRSRWSPYH